MQCERTHAEGVREAFCLSVVSRAPSERIGIRIHSAFSENIY